MFFMVVPFTRLFLFMCSCRHHHSLSREWAWHSDLVWRDAFNSLCFSNTIRLQSAAALDREMCPCNSSNDDGATSRNVILFLFSPHNDRCEITKWIVERRETIDKCEVEVDEINGLKNPWVLANFPEMESQDSRDLTTDLHRNCLLHWSYKALLFYDMRYYRIACGHKSSQDFSKSLAESLQL